MEDMDMDMDINEEKEVLFIEYRDSASIYRACH